MARVVVVGAGVVGTAGGVGLARCGHDVGFVDADPARVAQLRADGLDARVDLDLTGEAALVLVCVPTPLRDGRHDVGAVESAARAFGAAIRSGDQKAVHTLVVRSTVPPGTCDRVVLPAIEDASGRRGGEGFLVASCPEFLREASALEDFLAPRVTLIGSRHPRAIEQLVALLGPLGGEVLTIDDPAAAELAKCTQNAWNATKISFFNEVWRIARVLDVDSAFVSTAVARAAEGSYNPHYGIRGGTPFSGSCLEKDTHGLVSLAAGIGVPTPVLDAALAVNAAMRASVPPWYKAASAPLAHDGHEGPGDRMSRPVRIAAQPPDEWSESTRAEFAGVDEAARHRLHLPAVIANHPTFLPPYMTWAKAVALNGVLARRDNALLALRTGFRCDSEFEWGVHAETAVLRAGLDADEVARVAAGPDAPGWSARDAALLRAADELHDASTISDATWDELAEYFTPDARLEVAFVCGHYTMLSMVANTVGVEPEEQWQPLPTSTMGEQ